MLITALDHLRSLLLRNTLRVEPLAKVYVSKPWRTFFLFTVSLTTNSILLTLFPKFSSYWGPLILGVPHLIASVRATARSSSEQTGFDLRSFCNAFLGIGLVFSILKAIETHTDVPPGILECAAILTLVGLIAYRFKRITWSMGWVLFVFFFIFFTDPLYATLFLLIAHNFIAFLYWYREARTSAERKIPIFSFLLLITYLLILIRFTHPDEAIADSIFGAREYFPNAASMITIFLLSQSAHYFIWLKAIPDYQNSSATPAPFSTTLKNIENEFGVYSLPLFALASLFIAGSIFFVGLENSRMFYLYLSSFHGLGEIAVLASTPWFKR